VIEENLEKIWGAKVSAQKGLEDADKGSNLILKRFEKLRGFFQ
jgi:hypothetical protein